MVKIHWVLASFIKLIFNIIDKSGYFCQKTFNSAKFETIFTHIGGDGWYLYSPVLVSECIHTGTHLSLWDKIYVLIIPSTTNSH